MDIINKGKFFILSGPSGVGKSTIIKHLLQDPELKNFNLQKPISYTTRPPRNNEINGKDYFFVSEQEFKTMIKQNKFLEWAKVHKYLYGTSKEQILQTLYKGTSLIKDIDVQGALNIKKILKEHVILIFISPPNFDTLIERIKKRGDKDPEEIEIRINTAHKELEYKKYYQYDIINDNLQKAINKIKNIIIKELTK